MIPFSRFSIGPALLAVAALAVPLASSQADSAARALPPPVQDLESNGPGLQTAVFSGGCFWGVQGVFEHVRGVTRAVSGYTGGQTFIDTHVTNGTEYFYQITAVNNNGTQSAKSDEAGLRPQLAPVAPTLSFSNGGDSITLDWTFIGGATNYDIYRSTTAGAEGTTPYVSGYTGGETFTDTHVSPGVTYYYEVTAVNDNGTASVKSNEVTVKIEL